MTVYLDLFEINKLKNFKKLEIELKLKKFKVKNIKIKYQLSFS